MSMFSNILTTSSSCPCSGFWSPPSTPWFLRRFSAGFQHFRPWPTDPPSFALIAGRLLRLFGSGNGTPGILPDFDEFCLGSPKSDVWNEFVLKSCVNAPGGVSGVSLRLLSQESVSYRPLSLNPSFSPSLLPSTLSELRQSSQTFSNLGIPSSQ